MWLLWSEVPCQRVGKTLFIKKNEGGGSGRRITQYHFYDILLCYSYMIMFCYVLPYAVPGPGTVMIHDII